ncbi:MAG: hypothetical protein AB7H97_09385 [Pseudobdellovibrionaceae bacterium]
MKTRKTHVLLCVFILFFYFDLIASEEKPEEDHWTKTLIDDNIKLSELFDRVADGLDVFLAGKRVTNKKNETRVKFDNTTVYTEGMGAKNYAGIGVNLRLPNFEEYWRLKFSSYDEQEANRGVKRGYLKQGPREQNYGASVGFFRKLGDFRASFEPRIDLQDPLKVSHSLMFQSVAEVDYYEVNPKLEFFASPTKGVGNFVALNFNFDFTKDLTLTFLNEGEYLDKQHSFSVTNGFSFGQVLTDRTSLSYNYLVDFVNRPSYHMDGYNASISWNHVLYRKILDYSLVPSVDFRKARKFRGLSSLALGVTVNF